MTGPDPVMLIPASQNLNSDLVDGHPTGEDEGPYFADQDPLPSPTLYLYLI
jgi:hypothetical protein